jgi:S-adenosylmethionine synthetase
MHERLITSESVTEGHPDKVADQISDAVLDAALAQDRDARVACDVLVAAGLVVIGGQLTTTARFDPVAVAREVIRDVGYRSREDGLSADTCNVLVAITEQSPQIASAVVRSLEERLAGAADRLARQGAGDQGLMVGYASDETPELMPLPITLANRLCEQLARVRRGPMPYLRPDGKAQVTVRVTAGRPDGVAAVVISAQHTPDVPIERLRAEIVRQVIQPVLEQRGLWSEGIPTYVNPGGPFEIGGPAADCGLTGRKIVVDTYGGVARHGGGAFSGKDPSKVDRSGAYAARWVAKSVVAAGLAASCEVQIAYAIGVAQPIAVSVDCLGTERDDVAGIERWIDEAFDLRPAAIIEALDLLRPIYRKTAAYGHFGRDDPDFTWEQPRRAS